MNRLFAPMLACLAGLAFVTPGTAAAADLALVVGNHDYEHAPDARHARIDAKAVEEALERGGYEVISGTDMNRNDMRNTLIRFAERVGAADRVVVFYSGHALNSGGVSYLATADQRHDSMVQAVMDSVPLALLLLLAGEAPGRAAVFVDAAQRDGFATNSHAEPGLAEIDVPAGVVMVSAAAPGRTIAQRPERQSAFARQVIERFLAPGRRVSDAVSGLDSSIWARGDTRSSLVLVPSARGQTSASAAAQTEARLDLSARDKYRLQQGLTRLGHDTRGADGVFGPGTRTAIRGWQRANDLDGTGYLTEDQVAQLDRQVGEAETASAARIEGQLDLNAAERRDIQRNLTRLGHDTRGTDGNFGSGTRSAIGSWQERNDLAATGYLTEEQVAQLDRQVSAAEAARNDPATVEAGLNLNVVERRDIQENLTGLGHDTRGTDGNFGSGTRTAIRNWQRANDLDETGYLTADQVAQLERQVSAAEADRDPATIESRLDLSAAERREIQESLTRLGYATRGTDGNFGSGTRTAIRNWQRANELGETGYLTSAQVTQLDRQVREANAATDGRSAAEIEAGLNLSAAERRDIQQSLTGLGYDTRGTDGNFGSGTRTAIRNWQRANDLGETGYLTATQVATLDEQVAEADAATAAEVEASLELTREDRLSIEQRLAHLGFVPGPQDGVFDGSTRQAIASYQRNRDRQATGYLNRDTISSIVEETQGSQTGMVEGARMLQELIQGLGNQQ